MRPAVTKLPPSVRRIGNPVFSAGAASSMTCGVIDVECVSSSPASSTPRLAASAEARMMSSRSPEVAIRCRGAGAESSRRPSARDQGLMHAPRGDFAGRDDFGIKVMGDV